MKISNTWKLNNPFLNNQWFKGETAKEIRKYLKNERKNTTKTYGIQKKQYTDGNLLNVHLKRSRINNLTLQLKELKNEE